MSRSVFRVLYDQAAARAKAALHYFTVQGVTIAANLLYGLLCVRLLPSSEYAKFVVVFGVQGTLLILMDVNFSGTLIPLIGDRIDDRKLIADYVASLRQLSYWSFGLVGLGTLIFYPQLVKHRGWNWSVIISMILILLLSTWFLRIGSAYGTVLIILRRRSLWYRAQVVSSVGTLILLLVFWAFHWLGPFSAILINVSGIVYIGVDYYTHARKLLTVVGVPSRRLERAIVGLALPNVPQAIFFALQGQVSLFLITFLGHTQGVSSVGALARLGQIFLIFKQANMLFIEPYFAKLPKAKMRRGYILALSVAAVVCVVVVQLTLWFPQLLLWVLGPQYAGLRYEVKLSIIAGAVSFFSSVMWTVHSARRFVYWWNVGLSIVLTIAVQALCIVKFDMSTVRGVLYLTLATNVTSLFINILSGAFGFLKGPRETEAKPILPPDAELVLEESSGVDALTGEVLLNSPLPNSSKK